ncbi:hypothetical protein Taro_019503 [Colocasia esculenta]|uniref:Rhodanese domain-containing protein n=1 Tax=Colocasia esculenta TaxID=4460 RepID=A0A843V2E5_COLES|nr:hypothetical protein [Colocasia esculenta]
MLPLVCSAAPGCSPQFPISFPVGAKTSSLLWRGNEDRHNVEDRVFLGNQDGIHKYEVSFKPHSTRYLHSLVVEAPDSECASSIDSSIFSPYPNDLDDIVRGFSNGNFESNPESWSCFMKEMTVSYPMNTGIDQVETSSEIESVNFVVSNGGNAANELSSQSMTAEPVMSQNIELLSSAPASAAVNVLSEPATSGSLSVSDSSLQIMTENTTSISNTLEATGDEVSKLKENVEHLLPGILDSTTSSILKAQSAVEDTYDALVFSVKRTVDNLTGSVDNAMGSLFSSIEKSKDQADGKLTVISSNFKGGLYGAGNLAIDILRKAILSFEDLLGNATDFVVYSYDSAKTLLPAEVRETINTAEVKVLEILAPIGTALQKAYAVIQGLEKNLGFDPNDPVVQFTLIFIGSTTLGFSYWILKYGGYSGDLSPETTLELLKSDEDAVLIDVRPEARDFHVCLLTFYIVSVNMHFYLKDLRERDGVPDLRRRARFRYASVNLPKIDDSSRKLLRSARDVDDALISVVIQNLKAVKDGTKIIVLDASGDQSKAIARSLRRLGVKASGFRSWVKSGLRIKELQSETTLSVLNEEAEAILDDLRPTPLQIFGYSLAMRQGKVPCWNLAWPKSPRGSWWLTRLPKAVILAHFPCPRP